MPDELSVAQARRVALAAQGLDGRRLGERGGRVDRRHFRQVLDRLACVQIDSVSVIARAHELTFFARLGPYDRAALARWLHSSGEVFEYWGHAASFLPVELHPFLRWKMGRPYGRPGVGSLARAVAEDPEYFDRVLDLVRERGPLTPADLHDGDGPRRTGPWWGWDEWKRGLEGLFWVGEITATRGTRFERIYDVPERILPAEVLAAPTPTEEEGRRQLLRHAARALGVATANDLADYFRQQSTKVKPLLPAMVADGELVPVRVEGWKEQAYLHPDARLPTRVRSRALLAPFDSVVWERARAERLFDFNYRIEIYTPEPKRVYGYYVLPFLLGDRLVGRVDVKSDRAGSRLLAQAAWTEPGVDRDEVAPELAAELRLMADWLGLDDVVVAGRGDLAPALSSVLPAERSA